ncbi:MAG TPA: hypothetical protein EYG80_01070 [Flavobacteriaceae bacterium]|nr:hypothetical protein [Flavobacteriaceae bacterium]
MKTIYESLKFIDENHKYVNGFHEYTNDIPSLPQRLNRSLQVIKPKSLFILNSKPIILFFDKNVDKVSVFKQSWNFAEAPIIIIENETDFDIYNGFDYILDNGAFLLSQISKDNELNYISIISGKYFKDSKILFDKKDKKVDKKLLENIKEAREKLLDINLKENTNIANALLGRIIFIRYLIDRKVSLKFEGKHQPLTNEDLKEILSSKERTYKLFNYLKSKDGFNGDWFPIEDDEKTLVNEAHLNILQNLISGVNIKTNQGSLFDIYDFSIIPIEFISNVYESFIGEENQKKSGAYYTPTFLVDYILKYTVDEYFKTNPAEYNCKVLDPACGSGIFLVETLRKLINQYEQVTKKPITSNQIIKLVKDNIYGIDYNNNALQISVFSLYLTMLDYQNPKDIEKFKFPYLLKSAKNKNPNFFENDFFDLKAEYNGVLKRKNIDFIIGNPPYGKSTIDKNSFAEQYIKLNKIVIANRDIVQPFMVRVKDLVGESTKTSFIVTSKVLYNLQSKEFRTKYFFNQFKINHILELSSVRHEIFENADVPVSIIFYEHSTEEEVLKNTINYISMKPSPYFEKLKILLLSKSDFKKVNQSKLLENDYLWRILLYGSYLDFNFIKRLKSFDTINECIENPDDKQGITVKGKDKNPTLEYLGMPYIQTKFFKPFYIEKTPLKWEEKIAHRKKSRSFFSTPSLLVSKGSSLSLDLKVGVLQEDSIFTDSISAIKHKNQDDLYGIMGMLSSSFFKYYIINTGSSIGVEREQIHNPEKFSLPYIHDEKIIQSAKNIEQYSKNDFAQYDKKFDDFKNILNENVLNSFELTTQEKVLIDYSNNIMIPWIMQKNYAAVFRSLDFNDEVEVIEKYIYIFINHYSKIYKEINKYFSVEVLWDEYAIGIYFKVLDEEYKQQIIWKKEKNVQNFLKLSSGRTLENLFIQKDIKGFEPDGFYVVKPNEYKNWHEAIGYLDFYEFKDAILKAGKQKWMN